MKLKDLQLFLCSSILTLIAVSCGEQPKENIEDETVELVEEVPTEIEEESDPEIPEGTPIIDGCHATNTDRSIPGNSVLNAVDGDPETLWQTPRGSGPYEGIMLYFNAPISIASVMVDFDESQDHFPNTTFSVVHDGRNYSGGMNINTLVQSLYVRFSTPVSSKSEKDASTKTFYQNTYDTSKNLAVREIKCYDPDGNHINFVIPKVVKGTFNASSTLAPEASYSPSFLADGKYDFAWAEGAKGEGIGQEILLELEEEITIDKMKIWNGYQRSDMHFEDNARLSSFSLFAGSSESIGTFSIADQRESIIDVPNTSTKTISLTMDEVFSGGKYEDLVLSELRFYYKGRPYLIQTSHEDDVSTQNKEKANELLTSYLDRTFSISTDEEVEADYIVSKSTASKTFILRSNGSFVFYGEEVFYEMDNGDPMPISEDENTVIADGGWELVEQNDEEVKIRIFGKRYMLSSEERLYKSKMDKSTLKVFQDYVTLSKNEIKSNTTFAPMKILW